MNDFLFEIVAPMDRSTPAKFYYVMASRIFRADIQNYQNNLFFGHNICP
jgi:hypothetical protein